MAVTGAAMVALAKVGVVEEMLAMLEEPDLRSQMKQSDPGAPYTTEAFLRLAKKRFEQEGVSA